MNYHTIFIGGGINNLVAASLLAKKGKSVVVLERTKFLGGCIRSDIIDGIVIDVFSTVYPLFIASDAYALLKDDLDKEGIVFVKNNTPTATVLSDKRFAILTTDHAQNIKDFNQIS